MLYPTTTTIPFGAKNYDYRMATINRKHEHSTTHYNKSCFKSWWLKDGLLALQWSQSNRPVV